MCVSYCLVFVDTCRLFSSSFSFAYSSQTVEGRHLIEDRVWRSREDLCVGGGGKDSGAPGQTSEDGSSSPLVWSVIEVSRKG